MLYYHTANSRVYHAADDAAHLDFAPRRRRRSSASSRRTLVAVRRLPADDDEQRLDIARALPRRVPFSCAARSRRRGRSFVHIDSFEFFATLILAKKSKHARLAHRGLRHIALISAFTTATSLSPLIAMATWTLR